MTCEWTDPITNIEYEVEFTVNSDQDAAFNLIPVLGEVYEMRSEQGKVDWNVEANNEWFKINSKSIFAACNKAIDDQY